MLLIEYDIALQGNCLTCMVLGNFKIIKNEYINVLHVHQKKGNAKWVKDPARRNSRQSHYFCVFIESFFIVRITIYVFVYAWKPR